MAANLDRIRSDAASREVARVIASHFTSVTPTLLVRRELRSAEQACHAGRMGRLAE